MSKKPPAVKFMFSLGNQCYSLLNEEARCRDITVQQLIRAVIIPHWVKDNLLPKTNGVFRPSVLAQAAPYLVQRDRPVQPYIGRQRSS